jgi:hypothetical protein
MDLQSLTQLFATTYDSNPNIRKAGELAVRKVRALRVAIVHLSSGFVFCTIIINLVSLQLAGQEGVIPALLQIIASDSVDMYVSPSHICDLPFIAYSLGYPSCVPFSPFIMQRYPPGHFRLDQKPRGIVLWRRACARRA